MGQTVLDVNSVRSLATMPSLDELRAKIIGLVQAPATKLAQLQTAPAAKLARRLCRLRGQGQGGSRSRLIAIAPDILLKSNQTSKELTSWPISKRSSTTFPSLTVLEAADLAKLLEEKWGVSAAAAVAVAGPAAGAAAAPVEEQTDVHGRARRHRRQEDRGHQGGPRDHRPRPQGGQGPGRRRSQARQGKASTRTMPLSSRRSLRKPAPRWRSSKGPRRLLPNTRSGRGLRSAPQLTTRKA